MFVMTLCRNVSEGKLAEFELRRVHKDGVIPHISALRPRHSLVSEDFLLPWKSVARRLPFRIMSKQLGVMSIGVAIRSLALQPVNPLRTIQHVRCASQKWEAKSEPTAEVGFSRMAISYQSSHSVISRAVSQPPVKRSKKLPRKRKL